MAPFEEVGPEQHFRHRTLLGGIGDGGVRVLPPELNFQAFWLVAALSSSRRQRLDQKMITTRWSGADGRR
jgi:hypothetical protein